MKELPFNLADRLANAGPSLAQRFRASLTSANLWTTLKTLSWLIPLTIFAWFYAARSISTTEELEFPLSIQSSDPSRVVTIQRPADGKVKVTVIGPQSEVEQLKNRQGRELSIVLQATQVIGAQNPPVDALIENGTNLFRDSRVRIQRADPRQIEIFVDEYVERVVPVRVPAAVKNLESATFEPAEVTVRAPARDVAEAQQQDRLFVEADIVGLPQLKDPGKKDPLTVSLHSSFGGTLSPSSVTATLDVRSDDVAFVLPSVPVFVSVPPNTADEYKIMLDPQFVANVRVLGPPDQIALLKRENDFPYRAVLDFVASELREDPGRSRIKKPRFVLPDRVRVDPADADRIGIEWSLTRRSGT